MKFQWSKHGFSPHFQVSPTSGSNYEMIGNLPKLWDRTPPLNRKYSGFQIFRWFWNSVETNSVETSSMSPNIECVDVSLKLWLLLLNLSFFYSETDRTYLFLGEYDSEILRISSKSAATYVKRAWYRPDICGILTEKNWIFLKKYHLWMPPHAFEHL